MQFYYGYCSSNKTFLKVHYFRIFSGVTALELFFTVTGQKKLVFIANVYVIFFTKSLFNGMFWTPFKKSFHSSNAQCSGSGDIIFNSGYKYLNSNIEGHIPEKLSSAFSLDAETIKCT